MNADTDIVLMTPLRAVPLGRSVTRALHEEFRHCDPAAVAALIKLYQAHWYLQANDLNTEACQCAAAIEGLRRKLQK